MINLDAWLGGEPGTETDKKNVSYDLRKRSQKTVDDIVNDLVGYADAQGYSETQIRNAIEDLFRTFISEWVLYLFTAAGDLSTAINDDVSLVWLDLDAGGQTIRQRIIARL